MSCYYECAKSRYVTINFNESILNVVYFDNLKSICTCASIAGNMSGTSGSGEGILLLNIDKNISIKSVEPVNVSYVSELSGKPVIYVDSPGAITINGKSRKATIAMQLPYINTNIVTKVSGIVWRLKVADRLTGLRLFDITAKPGIPSEVIGELVLL